MIAISVDALNVKALSVLGPKRTPNFHRLLRQGAVTLNARTEFERTITLPNHTGMITGRRVARGSGGHGVTFNTDTGRSVHQAAGNRVASVFQVVHASGGRTALFASKTKFAMFKRSWPQAIDRFSVDLDNARLIRRVRTDLVERRRAFTFLHLSLPDDVGHARGFMSPAYLKAVRRTDRRLGELLTTITSHAHLRQHLTLVLTADHGGSGSHGHSQVNKLANYRVPFIIWGAGVTRGDLYAANPTFANPSKSRPRYRARRQPIRNGDLANVSTSLLGLRPVPGSEHNRDQSLRANLGGPDEGAQAQSWPSRRSSASSIVPS